MAILSCIYASRDVCILKRVCAHCIPPARVARRSLLVLALSVLARIAGNGARPEYPLGVFPTVVGKNIEDLVREVGVDTKWSWSVLEIG